MTKDPVCEINVDEIEALTNGLTVEYHGQTHYFCSTDCRDTFETNPGHYLLRFGVPEAEWELFQRPAKS